MVKAKKKINNFFIKRAISNLIFGFSYKVGKNFSGKITVFHKSSPFMKKYRIIDYNRILCSDGVLLSKEIKRSHTSFLGVVFFFIGFFSYIILPGDLNIGDVYKGFSYKFFKKLKYSTFLKNLPTGMWVHHIELKPGLGGILSRSAGSSSFVYSKWGNFVFLKLPSGKIKRLSEFCVCVFGISSNKDHKLIKKGKAGVNRLLGVRPTVRGVAMNPVDHPHGGGEGKRAKPATQKTPWGKRAKFVKTVKKKINVKIPV